MRRLNHKRLQHVTTLQQLGLLDETLSSMEDIAAIGCNLQQGPFEAGSDAAATAAATASNDRWKSEIDIYLVPETLTAASKTGVATVEKPKAAALPPVTVHVNNPDEQLTQSTKCVSGSDPALGSFTAGSSNSSLAGSAAATAKSCCDVSTVPNGNSPIIPSTGGGHKSAMFSKHSKSTEVSPRQRKYFTPHVIGLRDFFPPSHCN